MAVNFPNSELIISAGRTSQFPSLPLPQAVFSGRSNVGKSSLINCLLGRKSLARVSSTPGKTVTVNFYGVDGKAVFVDLPGYGFARRPESEKRQWSALTDGFFTKNPNFDLVKLALQLVDLGVGPTADDMMMIGCSNGQVSAVEAVTFAPNSAINWTPTITATGDTGMKIIMK